MKKTLITIIATVLVCCCVAGATYAWLVDKTTPITNTFTFGDINITLTETKGEAVAGKDNTMSFKAVPGATIAKDPKVTVAANSEACWLFVKITETNNKLGAEQIINYSVRDPWQKVNGTDNVYYIKVDSVPAEGYYVFTGAGDNANGFVTVNNKITKENLQTLASNVPTITVTAYAVQQEGFATAEAAWAEAEKLG